MTTVVAAQPDGVVVAAAPGRGGEAGDAAPPAQDLGPGIAGRFPYPTRRFAAVLAVAAVVPLLMRSGTGLLLVNVGALVLLLVDWALAPRPSRVAIDRYLPAVVALGTTGRIGWRLHNTTGRTVHVRFSDELAPSLRAGSRFVTVRLPAHAEADASTELRPARRGRFTVSLLTVRVLGPLGLAGRQRVRRRPQVLRVYPSFRSKKDAELRIDRARILEVGLRSARGRGGGTDFDQLREYSVDDEFRRIDWAATARLGKPIVRTFRAERNQTVICLLDNGRVMAGRVAGVPRVEHAMDAVLAVTTVATRLGDRAGLVAFDRQVRAVVEPGHTRAQLGRVTEAMYDLQPMLQESDYLGAFVETLARFRRRAMLVVLTDLVEQAVVESLLPAMPVIARQHLVLIGAVRDPDVVRWAAERPADADDVYRQAAALRAIEERRRTVARLMAAGATVVDAAPGRLAPALADAYLDVKAAGRL
ncbi:MAG: DUF58 domain-containing protein [Acidimicrobiales bacterium]|nr:DUF58 domain-containing protein [Acidimicrobiales bacterium]MCB1260026.1 DUF58 domain-containing protein [Acidimicrobiales bacterium]